MRYIALIAAILMMAVLSSCETGEQKKHREFYFEKITAGKLKEISQDYKDRLYAVFPKLKDTFDKLFNVVTA